MAEDLTRLAELSGQARECFLVYSYNHLAKFADFREQAHGYLQTALPGLSGALRTVARELSSIYQEQRERMLAEFGGMLRFQTVTEFGDQQSAFAEGWSEYRPRLRTLWNALAEPELRVGELIRTVV